MNLPISLNPSLLQTRFTLAAAKDLLTEQLRQWAFAGPEPASGGKRIIRLEVPIMDCSPLQWLSWQNHPTQLYWSNRDNTFEMAGIGIADKIQCVGKQHYGQALSQIQHVLSGHEGNARYYGGMRFDPDAAVDEHWRCYGTCFFILPRCEIVSNSAGSYFACNLVIDDYKKLPWAWDEWAELRTQGKHTDCSNSVPLRRHDNPDKAQWGRNLETALAIMNSGDIDKIVLSRRTTLEFETRPKSALLLPRLKEIEPVAYHFYIQPQPQYAFIGATPERLYKRRGRVLHSEAVAGTCARGKNFREDGLLGDTLLHSDKDYREHKMVRDEIQAVLRNYCRSVEIDTDLRLLKQSKVQHLYCRINGWLQDGVTDNELLQSLHPTPAVGGVPRGRAMQEIARLESFDRGWFAGPVGWIGHDAAEFAVGIRSAILNGQSLSLFAGAGVVPGSVAQLEWEEMENKIGVFLNALDIP
ncbi:MAG: isochorismate synthase [Candidatus Competibacteraceae bacterium]|nr:isochorismate synthase [Candidatus Competibacteraceae bacterium]